MKEQEELNALEDLIERDLLQLLELFHLLVVTLQIL
jgi:hypothetical protein